MAQNSIRRNPFKVLTPEHMRAEEAHALFVEPFTEFNKLCEPGHAMLNGARGSGKSMIFRYLLPDCQCLAQNVKLNDLEFLAFLVSIKNTGATASLAEFTESDNLNRNVNYVLNEHVLTIYIACKLYKTLSTLQMDDCPNWLESAVNYFESIFKRLLVSCGTSENVFTPLKWQSISGVFHSITDTCDELYRQMVQYTKRLAINEVSRYTGPLCGYSDFLLPAIAALRDLPFLPNTPVYLLIDDADYLNSHQTKVLNSWISTRTTSDVSIKVSTQFQYKSLATISGFLIESPHDFQEVNLADLYTSNRSQYLKRVRQIVKRRLSWRVPTVSRDIALDPDKFFPVNEEQERRIEKIKQKLRADFPEKGKGYRVSDDVTRYARPDYIRSLGGKAKSGPTYSYAGFAQLVHISSGLIRYFLESAAIMFDDQVSQQPDDDVTFIEPSIQDNVIRAEADKLLGITFDKFSDELQQDRYRLDDQNPLDKTALQMEQLRKLIRALGGMFYVRLVSSLAERRIFSVAISGDVSWDVKSILDLGVKLGFFHRAMIGNKDGTGRTPLYVLTRRLAPFFKLDPSSFAGYLRLTDDALRNAIRDPEGVVRRAKEHGTDSWEVDQLSLFERGVHDHGY